MPEDDTEEEAPQQALELPLTNLSHKIFKPIAPMPAIASSAPVESELPPMTMFNCPPMRPLPLPSPTIAPGMYDARIMEFPRTLKCQKCNEFKKPQCCADTPSSSASYPESPKFPLALLHGDDFFYFECAQCRKADDGSDSLQRLNMSWCDVVHLTLYNMHLLHAPTTVLEEGGKRFYQLRQDIVSFIDYNWDQFWLKPRSEHWITGVSSALSNSVGTRFLSGKHTLHNQGWWALVDDTQLPSSYNTKSLKPAFNVANDGTLTKVAVPSKPHTADGAKKTKLPKTLDDRSTSVTPNSDAETVSVMERPVKKRAPPKKKLRKVDASVSVIDLYLDVVNPLKPVKMSTRATHTASQVKQEPGNIVWNEKGYRMAKATHSVDSGVWYFEVEVLESANNSLNGNVRLGWSQISGDLQAPCGFDTFSYSYRMSPGTIFQNSEGSAYGSGYKVGDIVGCLISLHSIDESKLMSASNDSLNTTQTDKENLDYEPLPAPWDGISTYETVKYYGHRPRTTGSHVRFFVNGVDQGIAFNDLYTGKYHPAVSTYMGGRVRVIFGGPECPFKFPPSSEFNAIPMSERYVETSTVDTVMKDA